VKGSKPCSAGAYAIRQGQDIRAAQCVGFFPLTPALSLGERVIPSLRGEQSRPVGFTLRDARCCLSLRERVRVRGNGRGLASRVSDCCGNCQTGESSGRYVFSVFDKYLPLSARDERREGRGGESPSLTRRCSLLSPTLDTATRTSPEIVELSESSDRAGGF